MTPPVLAFTLLAGEISPVMLLVVGVVFFLTGMMWWRVYKDRRRNAAKASVPLPPDAALAARHAADKALTTMLDMGRELTAQVDTKIRLLNRLVKEADERIEQLRALSRPAGPAKEPSAPPAVEPAPTSSPATVDPSASSGGSAAAVAPAASRTGPSPTRRVAVGALAGLSARALALCEAGKSREEIQSLTGLSAMEVDLALAMARDSRENSAEKAL